MYALYAVILCVYLHIRDKLLLNTKHMNIYIYITKDRTFIKPIQTLHCQYVLTGKVYYTAYLSLSDV